ncbi:hypothetical protein A8H39_19570 [Paraburkholderia fungorum]|nr:hypothetical protein A8H39_19570 [Paraburkholderia fungorum]
MLLSLSLPRLRSQQRGRGWATASREPRQTAAGGRSLVTAMLPTSQYLDKSRRETAAGESRRETAASGSRVETVAGGDMNEVSARAAPPEV